MKSFAELNEREILALAIASEEDDNRVYMTFAEDLHDRYPSTAKVFEEMAMVEAGPGTANVSPLSSACCIGSWRSASWPSYKKYKKLETKKSWRNANFLSN